MDVNEEEVLFSLREMGAEELPQNGAVENGHSIIRHPKIKPSLQWLDIKVFYVRLSKCVVDDDSAPEHLTLNHVPLNRDTLLEVNCVRTSIYSDGVSTLLKRLDRRSEEVTFVSTDSVRTTGSVQFEVYRGNVLVLSGGLELCQSNGRHQGQSWSMRCEGNQGGGMESVSSPVIVEVYVAGCFLGSPIVLTQSLQLSQRRKQMRKGMLEAIPEYEAAPGPSTLALPLRGYKEEEEGEMMEYLEGEDGELSWFNAGVRVGVGLGLGICVGVGVGVGLLVRTYQGTARNFTRRLL